MMFGQYCRIESRAGGVGCSDREFIRAALSCIKKQHRFGKIAREYRKGRHMWLRDGLKQKQTALADYNYVTGGLA